MVRTYVDSSVIIAAYRGQAAQAERAFQVLNDPNRDLVVSDAVRLELLPKAEYNRKTREVQLLQELFQRVRVLTWSVTILKHAHTLACRYGLSAMDAIHLAFAQCAGVDEFVTGEGPTKPLFRANQHNQKPRIISLR